jgi:hypothetical protein
VLSFEPVVPLCRAPGRHVLLLRQHHQYVVAYYDFLQYNISAIQRRLVERGAPSPKSTLCRSRCGHRCGNPTTSHPRSLPCLNGLEDCFDRNSHYCKNRSSTKAVFICLKVLTQSSGLRSAAGLPPSQALRGIIGLAPGLGSGVQRQGKKLSAERLRTIRAKVPKTALRDYQNTPYILDSNSMKINSENLSTLGHNNQRDPEYNVGYS